MEQVEKELEFCLRNDMPIAADLIWEKYSRYADVKIDFNKIAPHIHVNNILILSYFF
jgi:hypothetical protein